MQYQESHLEFSNDPVEVVTYWRWLGTPVLRNSWAWVHGIYFLLAVELSFKTLLLILVTVKHTREKAFWIGDALSSIVTARLWIPLCSSRELLRRDGRL